MIAFTKKTWSTVHTTIKVFIIYTLCVVALSLISSYFIKNTYPYKSSGIYDEGFYIGVLGSANSSIIDFLVIGVLVFFLDKRNSLKEESDVMMTDLRDYATHSSLELDLKKAGLIQRLNKNNIKTINIQRIRIHKVDLKNFALYESDLSGLSLIGSKLENIEFDKCTLRSINLTTAKMKKVIFKNSMLKNMKAIDGNFSSAVEFHDTILLNANFTNSNFRSCLFFNCNMEDVNYEKADLRSANLKGSYNININKLCRAKNLDYMIADQLILDGIKTLRPDVKFNNGNPNP